MKWNVFSYILNNRAVWARWLECFDTPGKQVAFLTQHIQNTMTFSEGTGHPRNQTNPQPIHVRQERARKELRWAFFYGFHIKRWHVCEGMRVLKRPSPGCKHADLVISRVAFPFQDLFDAFVIARRECLKVTGVRFISTSVSKKCRCCQVNVQSSLSGIPFTFIGHKSILVQHNSNICLVLQIFTSVSRCKVDMA